MPSAIWACALVMGAWHVVPHSPARPAPPGRSLAESVRALNTRAARDAIGREQPPLTADEVVAAIEWMAVDRPPGTTDLEMRALQGVARSRQLPAGVGFEFMTGFQPDDRTVFKAWSVRIVVPKPDGGTHAFVIRDRWISSRAIGPKEREVIRRWDEKWRKQGGIASFDRPRYSKERAAAEEQDRQAAR